MNKVLNNYIVKNYLIIVFNATLLFTCMVILLNLFQEIEFFKDLNVSFETPLVLTLMFVPNIVVKMFPFIIFASTMYYLVDINKNKELITFKIFGFSNIKIITILSVTTFLIGLIILLTINPITSSMVKYYEQIKSKHSEDVDHLVSINKNGLWIKENLEGGQRIISASSDQKNKLKDLIIFNFDKNYLLKEKIFSETANIREKNWILENVTVLQLNNGISVKKNMDKIIITSIYDYEKITSLFKNFDTLSFLDLILNYKDFVKKGYNKIFLDQSLHSMLSLPFFLFIMTSLASIMAFGTLKKSNNVKLIIIGIITCVIVFYLKDLSLALGKTNRISLVLATWMPILIIGIFSSIGILQVNEK